MSASFRALPPDTAGLARLECGGDFNYAARPAIIEQLDRLIDDDGVKTIVVDMAGVDFIDSSCIGALIGAKLGADKAGKTFQLRGTKGLVTEVLTIAGVLPYLTGPEPDAGP